MKKDPNPVVRLLMLIVIVLAILLCFELGLVMNII
ncbi:hypothetical protein HDC90_003788 [Pedobacter sp. AK013]|nr:hypothetical protein [Pedobacter sp. AK013]